MEVGKIAAIKSIKCYDFTRLNDASYLTFNMQFYDLQGQLIILDFSNPIGKSTETYCETNECIVTANGKVCYGEVGYPCNAFHTANTNNTLGLEKLGICWRWGNDYSVENDWIKIEFKTPLKLSDIKILNSYWGPNYGFDECDYDIVHENSRIETGHYKSDGLFISIPWQTSYANRNQKIVDAKFASIDFNKAISIYDMKIGYVETLDTNNFRNISINTVKKLKSLCVKPKNTFLSCLISFDKKQTWKAFNGTNWNTISDISPENIILNGTEVDSLDELDKNKLITGGFTGDLDFKIAMKTNDVNKTPSVTKIYIEYK